MPNRLTSTAVALALSALVMSPAALAQSTGPVGTNIPSGSPVDPTLGSQGGQQGSLGSQTGQDGSSGSSSTGPALFGPTAIADQPSVLTRDDLLRAQRGTTGTLLKKPAEPGEFEKYVERLLGRKLPRFGSDLLLPSQRDFAAPATSTVPPSYIINPGDKIAISLTGSIEGSVIREVDTNGNIFLTNVGAISVAGVRYADLRDRIAAAVGRQYRGYEVSVAISELRGIRVYVTGFANNPGAFTVNSLSTLANAVFQAGGPNSGGSFRTIKLYRNGQEVVEFDLYELLRGGNRVNDIILQNEDVLFIPPVGPQVAIFGSVNQEAIYEAKAGESIESMLAAAGGPTALGDSSRLILYRTNSTDILGPQQIRREEAPSVAAIAGDLIQVVPKGSLTQPTDRQSVLVRIDGEVNKPGVYYVSPNTPTSQIIALAGGLTPNSFVYGTKFTRQSVRLQQQESYREAIRQLEIAVSSAPISNEVTTAGIDRQAQAAAARALVEKLKEAEPDGRVVMPISITATSLPENIVMENNDTITVPRRPTTVGVFGAVYRPASFLLEGRPLKVDTYLRKAGGTLRSADKSEIFLVRANGEVLSRRNGAMSAYAYPGDVVFVPIKTEPNLFWTRLKDITSTLFQFGVSAATVAAVAK